MTQKVVINKCFGGFSLSEVAENLYCAYAGIQGESRDAFYNRGVRRDDPILIQVLEQLGYAESSGRHADLHIVEVPDGVEWTVEEYDGKEWVAEVHRTWR